MTATDTPKKNPYIHVRRHGDNTANVTISKLTLNRPDNGEALVKDLDLTLKPGDRLLLSGASGSGKSTLIRAIREIWDAGQGDIALPSDARIITASQKAYSPTTSLKGVLSYPAAESDFYDVQIERALRAVGHDRLVQYLPDRQPLYIINLLLDRIPSALEAMDQTLPMKQKVELLADSLLQDIPDLVRDNLDIVHHLSYQNERDLRLGIIARLDNAFGHSMQRNQVEYLATRISTCMNQCMAHKLVDFLLADIPKLVARDLGKIEHIDLNGMEHYIEKTTGKIGKKLTASLDKAHVNPLTDEQSRYVTEQISMAIENELSPYLTWNYTFNRVAAAIDGVQSGASKLSSLPSALFSLLSRKGKGDSNASQDNANADRQQEKAVTVTNGTSGEASSLRSRDWFLADKNTIPARLTGIFMHAASCNLDRLVHLLRLPMLNSASKKSADYMIGRTARYLAGQTINGDVLSKRLSGGEQQRVIFARALLHQPDILILDEVTAALDRDAGLELYDEIIEKLPNTIIISVAHNMHILDHHTLHGHLQEREIKVTPVAPKPV